MERLTTKGVKPRKEGRKKERATFILKSLAQAVRPWHKCGGSSYTAARCISGRLEVQAAEREDSVVREAEEDAWPLLIAMTLETVRIGNFERFEPSATELCPLSLFLTAIFRLRCNLGSI